MKGTVKDRFRQLELDYELFVKMAEANWDAMKHQYVGIRTMGRTLGISSTTVVKYLRQYDKEIGRIRL